ncbi:adenosine 5'-monophosphoramidase, putative [Trypanosoma brucei gambiense DAL972]|uniref:Adenosine 5'-monophosphoramidase, putative n=1 Tax=Trypanosoma brucei gambiense (strain MHOM/CI/86/DAL972) TaxID=679716 RepID=C9ZT59_TRYB9|nr:adenosine 5'-monophosphoramidase, putative [Trypanosoma brucei gambiense DAL972]CBH12594.1 adenosine 5'-monophosphoramidase, putative [Trypanosoma brucei gambiense DAL972]|eukprot:XP_011774874.1 adenosine 5'-monophosphoramidase, putative [Trypanosoma brucei gambiense DAL972]
MPNCIFCKIVEGAIPCHKVVETAKVLAFMDINPLSRGHLLVIPKAHAEFLHEVEPDTAAELGSTMAKVARAVAGDGEVKTQYNVLQNNGSLAHQEVPHVHFHIIPRRSTQEGLSMNWKTLPTDHTAFAEDATKYREALEKL